MISRLDKAGGTLEPEALTLVVSGLPASGKSTLGRRLSPLLGLPVVDKDDILEELFPNGRQIGLDERRELSRAADDIFASRVTAARGAIAVSFWRHAAVSEPSGTPVAWLEELPRIVEVHCSCDPAVALQRFVSRSRHPGHGDGERSIEALRAQFDHLESLGSLGVGPLLVGRHHRTAPRRGRGTSRHRGRIRIRPDGRSTAAANLVSHAPASAHRKARPRRPRPRGKSGRQGTA